MAGAVVRGSVVVLVGTTVLFSGLAAQAAYEDPDWPCIQRLVPEFSAATIWDGPPIDDALRAWREKPAIRDLVARLAARPANSEQAERKITAFVKTLKNGEKNPALTMLFVGLWVTLNDKRRTVIEGIKRFARQQRDRAERIEKKLLDLDRISANTTTADRAKIEELRHDMALEVRIFEDREKSITYLCEQPVKIESTLGGLARVISSQLD